MKDKKFQHNKIEICKLCKKEINTDKDNYSVIIDYTANTLRGLSFYHLICLKDFLFTEKMKLIREELDERWKQRANGMLGNVFNKIRQLQT